MPVEINEDELYAELSKLPDFDCMPIPISWYKKYNIPPRTIETTREFLESRYTINQQYGHKDLPPIIMDEPQRDGELVVVPHEEEIKVEVISRAFDWDGSKPFPAVLPFLKDMEEKEKAD